MKALTTTKYLFPYVLVTSLFFFWGFVHNLDPVLIPHLRKAFRLTDLQASLIDSSVFAAYFLMALPAGFIMRKYGYKSGIIIGLLLFGLGSILFVPAANTLQYMFFLGALFIIACGLTFLETAANPYATILGPKETTTQRLNFSQSFNGLAAFIAPAYVGKLILSGTNYTQAQLAAMSETQLDAYIRQEASSVKIPYFVLGLIIFLVAIIFYLTKLPDIKDSSEGESKKASFKEAFQSVKLKWGIVAQFFYVGAQVCVMSFFIRVATDAGHVTEHQASTYLGYAGLAFMLGRFIGTSVMQKINPRTLLGLYALISILFTIVVMFASGMSVIIALIGIAFFMSIMFPTIFSIGIEGLGHNTKLGSSLIVMSIVGGAILPPILGKISDTTGNIQYGYIVPLICFLVVLAFAIRMKKFNIY